MMKKSDVAWTAIGITAVLLSGYLLYHEIRNLSLEDLTDSLAAIGSRDWLFAVLATLGAYTALAWYDRIAIAHLGKSISWWFITLCSFTTYALAHNIGASVFSGALVRYRAYRSKGLTPQEIGILIVFCSLTFVLGTLLAAGIVLILRPELLERLVDGGPGLARLIGTALLVTIGLYIIGAWRQLRPWHRQTSADSRPAGAGLRGGDHLFRPASRRQSRLSGDTRHFPRVLFPGAAVPCAGRPRCARADLPGRAPRAVDGRCAGGADRVPRALSAAALHPGDHRGADLRSRPMVAPASSIPKPVITCAHTQLPRYGEADADKR